MSDEKNSTQNQDSEQSSIPPSPQKPTEPATKNTGISESLTMPPEAPEAPKNSADAISPLL